ncbi:MAG: phosphoglycerate dehydrogenase, partial [Pseudonocardia sp.]|nr:phosphoglycerate dehydrogenase [Pseudonocardia sp.]
MKVLLLEGIHPVAAEMFRRAGCEVDVRAGALSEEKLVDELSGVELLGIRSNTRITPAVL